MATDALGRTLPTFAEAGPPRAGRTVGMFYFLWLGEHGSAGPYDITKILKQDPGAMQKPDSPLWGALGVPHHWAESVFGYYRSDDPWVLRKHAQMLSDAGVDVVVFDVTNQLTYPRSYNALCRVWSQVRAEGGRTPQIAFLCPFGSPAAVVESLYDDLYGPGRHADLWFRWQGKPLIMADPAAIRPEALRTSRRTPGLLEKGRTYGQSFTATAPFTGVGGSFPTYSSTGSRFTLSLYEGAKPGGKLLRRQTFPNAKDNAVALLEDPVSSLSFPPGAYYLEMTAPVGTVGWWSESGDRYAGGQAWEDGAPASGDRTLYLRDAGQESATARLDASGGMTAEQAAARAARLRAFFTFRKPQPDYFAGQTAPNQWGWLEVYPQKPFGKSADGKRPEQLPVGVAQNAADGKLSMLSHPRAHGRSFHDGAQPPPEKRDHAGRNFAEQWRRALSLDPDFVFVTGWNEWIAGRFDATAPFYDPGPVNFVDQFDHEFSRDIEPVVGGHGDAYYYQFAAYVRRYKGVRPPLPPAAPLTTNARALAIDGRFADWQAVGTAKGAGAAYEDDRFDDAPRDHPAWSASVGANGRYVNRSAVNDITTLKVAHDARYVYFYARTRRPVRDGNGPGTLALTLTTGDGRKTLLRIPGGSSGSGGVRRALRGSEVEVAVPRAALGFKPGAPIALAFQWRDHVGDADADPLNLYRNGDAAPNGRFRYVYRGR
ncbi:MAG TPA: hypothetical protein VM490_24930 [Armatimonadaceae bacterium]|nr:hypothetical protein [Armatimonadaceae bacterium]